MTLRKEYNATTHRQCNHHECCCCCCWQLSYQYLWPCIHSPFTYTAPKNEKKNEIERESRIHSYSTVCILPDENCQRMHARTQSLQTCQLYVMLLLFYSPNVESSWVTVAVAFVSLTNVQFIANWECNLIGMFKFWNVSLMKLHIAWTRIQISISTSEKSETCQ